MSLFQSFDINTSALTAQRFRMDVISENVANVTTTRTEDGTPYTRKIVTFREKNVTPFSKVLSNTREAYLGNGVKVSKVSVHAENLTYVPCLLYGKRRQNLEFENAPFITSYQAFHLFL